MSRKFLALTVAVAFLFIACDPATPPPATPEPNTEVTEPDYWDANGYMDSEN